MCNVVCMSTSSININNQIKKISVTSLFGLFDYEIPLCDSGITILIGANGTGKTTMFKILHCIMNNEFHELINIDFEKFNIYYEDGSVVSCKRDVSEADDDSLFIDSYTRRSRKPNNYVSKLNKLWDNSKIMDEFSLTLKGNNLRYEHFFVKRKQKKEKFEFSYIVDDSPDITSEILEPFMPTSRFIETQRLQLIGSEDKITDPDMMDHIHYYKRKVYGSDSNHNINASITKNRIEDYAKHLSKTIKSRRSDYFVESQDVEKKTLSEYLEKPQISFSNYEEKVEDIEHDVFLMEEHMKKLFDLGIYNQNEMTPIGDSNLLTDNLEILKKFEVIYDEDGSIKNIPEFLEYSLKSSLLKSYAENMRKKLDIFEDLESKIKLFVDIINGLFKYAKLKINLEKGFVFSLEDNHAHIRNIDSLELSSGEQHEVILNYELIFHTKQNSLILIDEPELSLHVSWQRQFIDNLLNIARENNLTILVATHSPDIVHSHRNMVHVLSKVE